MVALFFVAQACVGDEVESRGPSVPDGGSPSSDAMASTSELDLIVVPPTEILRGGSVELTFHLAWRGAPSDIQVRFTGLPPEFSATTALAVPSGTFDGTIRLSTTDEAPFGESPVQLEAVSGERRVSALVSTNVFVRGAPGSLDTSFGVAGKAQLPPEAARASKVTPTSDGGFVVAGYGYGTFASSIVAARYNRNGLLDSASHGVVKLSPPFEFSRGHLFDVTVAGSDTVLTLNYEAYWVRAFLDSTGVTSLDPAVRPSIAGGGFPFSAMPQGNGVINNGGPPNSCRLVRNLPDGAQDMVWGDVAGATALAAVPTDWTCISSVLAASPNQLLAEARLAHASLGTKRSLTLLSRLNGKLVKQFDLTPAPKAAAAGLDGSFFIATPGISRTLLHVDPLGNLTEVKVPLEFDSEQDVSVFVTSDGNPAYLIADPSSRVTRIQLLERNGGARQPLLLLATLESDLIADAGPAPLIRETSSAFEVDHRRVVVFHYRNPTEEIPAAETNPHWVIRRYWL